MIFTVESSATPKERPLPRTTLLPSLPPVSTEEAMFYYAGLPSHPRLVARTGTTPYTSPTGPEAYPLRKDLRIVGKHIIQDVWEDNLALKVHAILNEVAVDWTSTDIVRIGYVEKPASRVVLWIGVVHGSLSYDRGIDVARKCEALLLEYGIGDVDVEIRESVAVLASGQALYEPRWESASIAQAKMPFTSTAGIPVYSRATPHMEGTGGFFLHEGGSGGRLLLVTTRHVVFPYHKEANRLVEHTSDRQHRYDIAMLSDASFQKHCRNIRDRIHRYYDLMDLQLGHIEYVRGRNDVDAEETRVLSHGLWEEYKEKAEKLDIFQRELEKHWSAEESRILGHVLFSPPIAVSIGTKKYTQDLAVIAVDPAKIDSRNFTGNILPLGDEFAFSALTDMVHPNPFEEPSDRLLRLRGVIPDRELRTPLTHDKHGQRCIIVLKRGSGTGLTVGCANNLFSYTRGYLGDGQVSKEWAILPFNRKHKLCDIKCKSGIFAAKGDSGAAIVDGTGRIGGVLTGGAGSADASKLDVTYGTPAAFVMKTIRNNKMTAEAHLAATAF